VLEGQFRRYYDKASNMKGVTGENLLQLLERRLDNVIFRTGLGSSRAQARQLVRHGHILIGGKKVDIPSYLVEPGDVVTIKARTAGTDRFKALREGTGRILPKWLAFDAQNLTATVQSLPTREDVDLTIQEQLIVEHYSR